MCGYRTMWTCQPMQESQRVSCTVVQLLHARAIPSSYRTHWTLSEFISSFVCSIWASPRAQALLFRTLLPNEIYRVIKSYEQFRKFLATFTYVRLSHNVKGFSCSVVQLLHARAIISHSYTCRSRLCGYRTTWAKRLVRVSKTYCTATLTFVRLSHSVSTIACAGI